MTIGKEFDYVINSCIKKVCSERQVPDDVELLYTDNLGEIVEKLIIVHIRMWMIEDQLGITFNPHEIAALKKKTDICFKIKRPRFVESINRIISDAIVKNKSLVEDSVKLYEGVDK